MSHLAIAKDSLPIRLAAHSHAGEWDQPEPNSKLLVAFFALKWLPWATERMLLVLAMLAALTNFAAGFFLT